jgi:DNA-nicking Smr family endonuclease
MNIGDKVRMLRGSEEGVITRFLDKGLIEVEIEDGFPIPVMREEVVVIAKEEATYFRRDEQPKIIPATPTREEISKAKSNQGSYLAFVQFNDKQLSVYFVNATDFDMPYLIGEEANENFKGLTAGLLHANNYVKVKDVLVSEFDQWPTLVIQSLFYRNGYFSLREPLTRKMKFKAATFFKSQRQAPVLNKPAFLFSLDEGTVAGKPIDPDKIKERMYANTQEQEMASRITFSRPPAQVDLHIEKLTQNYDTMNKSDMLELQLKTFEDALDKAIATGMDEITFIHGVGNGTLRNSIHKKLSKMDNIKYFEDSMKEKFGYGATLVRIK